MLRKQNSYVSRDVDSASPTASSLGLKIHRKVTLDNPAILEQQLEALEHHKKQLEKRRKLNQTLSGNNKSIAIHFNAPKLSSSSLLMDVTLNPHNFSENANVTYANTLITSTTTSLGSIVGDDIKSNVYGNIIASSTAALNNIYSNIDYNTRQAGIGDKNVIASLGSFSKKKSVLSLSEDNSVYFAENGIMLPEDEVPPPPSPVSSSYSELRRATDVCKSNNMPQKDNNGQIYIAKPIVGYEIPHDHKISVASNDMRQLYINKPTYTTNDEFNNYNTRTQVGVLSYYNGWAI